MKNNLKLIREAYHISGSKLAKMIDTTPGQIYFLENGQRRLSHDWMTKISIALGCKPEDLIREDFNIDSILSGKNIDKDTISIRLYDVKASAGTGIINYDDNYFHLQLVLPLFNATTGLSLKDSDIKNNRFTFIKVEGDSMAPHINNDDLILVDHSKNTVEHHRQILVFRDTEGQLYMKEVHIPYTNKLSIISYNKAYESWEKEDRDIVLEKFGGKIDIIGKVIWSGKKVDYFR